MDTPIISPWIIYFIFNIGYISGLFIIGIPVILLLWIASYECDGNCNSCKALTKKYLIIGTISIVIGVLLPSSSTLTKMFIASKITPRNIQISEEYAEKAIDKIIEKISLVGDSIDKAYRISK